MQRGGAQGTCLLLYGAPRCIPGQNFTKGASSLIREHRSREKLESYYEKFTEEGILDPGEHPVDEPVPQGPLPVHVPPGQALRRQGGRELTIQDIEVDHV